MEDFVPVKPSRPGMPLIPDIRYHVDSAWSEGGLAEWRSPLPGYRLRDLFDDGEGCQVAMVRLDPGGEIPASSLHGHEHIFVLAGKLLDGTEEYGAGTYMMNPPGNSHRLFSHGGCLALIHRLSALPVPSSEDAADAGRYGMGKEEL